jgi:hypothetical protein
MLPGSQEILTNPSPKIKHEPENQEITERTEQAVKV